jgi:hypothetical protein
MCFSLLSLYQISANLRSAWVLLKSQKRYMMPVESNSLCSKDCRSFRMFQKVKTFSCMSVLNQKRPNTLAMGSRLLPSFRYPQIFDLFGAGSNSDWCSQCLGVGIPLFSLYDIRAFAQISKKQKRDLKLMCLFSTQKLRNPLMCSWILSNTFRSLIYQVLAQTDSNARDVWVRSNPLLSMDILAKSLSKY